MNSVSSHLFSSYLLRMLARPADLLSVCPEDPDPSIRPTLVSALLLYNHKLDCATYAGHPMAKAIAARIVFPTPYPSFLYMAGAKRGKLNPAIERRKETAASAKYGATLELSVFVLVHGNHGD